MAPKHACLVDRRDSSLHACLLCLTAARQSGPQILRLLMLPAIRLILLLLLSGQFYVDPVSLAAVGAEFPCLLVLAAGTHAKTGKKETQVGELQQSFRFAEFGSKSSWIANLFLPHSTN
jgi:hypothetical protein